MRFSMNLSSSAAAWPDTCTGLIGTWNTSAPVRYSPSRVRWIAVSFPGITEDERITVSVGSRWTHLCSFAAMSDRAEKGSPWEPVQHTTTSCGRIPATSSIGTTSWSDTRRYPSERAAATLWCMLRPRNATRRPTRTAASHTCWIRWMWLAKQATTTSRRASRMMSYRTGPTERSLDVVPGSSAFVESDRYTWMPRLASAAMPCRSVTRPSIGVWSSLKSPECRSVPDGRSMATAQPSGMEWDTR
jgi:hypothetical protein